MTTEMNLSPDNAAFLNTAGSIDGLKTHLEKLRPVADEYDRQHQVNGLLPSSHATATLLRNEIHASIKLLQPAVTAEYTAEKRAALSENSNIVLAMMDAEDRGDQAEADRLLSTLETPAHALMAIKNSLPGGAKIIREMNLNTRLADEKYGPDWLDRDEPDRRWRPFRQVFKFSKME